jgi:hypothetical protein
MCNICAWGFLLPHLCANFFTALEDSYGRGLFQRFGFLSIGIFWFKDAMNGNMKCYSLLWFLYKLPAVLVQCCGSVTFCCGSGKPKKTCWSYGSGSGCGSGTLVHLHHSSSIKSHK